MKKIIILIIATLNLHMVLGQEISIDFYPKKTDENSEEDYLQGKKILDRAYEVIKENNNIFQQADYMNIALAYSFMGVESNTVYQLLLKGKDINPTMFCAVLNINAESHDGDITKQHYYKVLGEKRYKGLLSECKNIDTSPMTLAEHIDEMENLDLSGLNKPLIERLIVLMDKDQRYRESFATLKPNWDIQKKLDLEVHNELITIFDEYGYPGKSVVGNKYKDYVCLMLEHTNQLISQEKYLPTVIDALKKKELNKGAVKMLIDRIHSNKYGTQIFGSQSGVPFAEDEIVESIKLKYGL